MKGLAMKQGMICLLLASSALAAPAFARSADGHGWYVGARVGFANLSNPEFSEVDVFAPNDRIDVNLRSRLGSTLGGEGGYDFGSGLRLGVELDGQSYGIRSLRVTGLGDGVAVTPGNVQSLLLCEVRGVECVGLTVRRDHSHRNMGDISQLGALATLAYQIPLRGRVQPFVGVGAGIAATGVRMIDAISEERATATRFAWQARAGVNVEIKSWLHVTADYTYRQVNGGNLSFSDLEGAYEHHIGKTNASMLQVGARFIF
jgi:opacity protein-like surface antigen